MTEKITGKKITTVAKRKNDIFCNIDDVIATRSIGPFCVGGIFWNIANTFGVPNYWGFSPGPEIDFYVGYKHLEIYVRSRGDIAEIYFIKLKAFRFTKSFSINSEKCRVVLSISQRWRDFDSSIEYLEKEGVEYTVGFEELVHPSTDKVINFPVGVRLYYTASSNYRSELHSVELS